MGVGGGLHVPLGLVLERPPEQGYAKEAHGDTQGREECLPI